MDHRHPGSTRLDRTGRLPSVAGEFHGSIVGSFHTGKDLHERAFARSILPDQRVDFARRDGEVDVS
jgi:hypothetical protein